MKPDRKQTSLRQIAKELGVSPSYLSQVVNGKRPASDKLLSNPSFKVLSNVKQNVKHEVDAETSNSYNLAMLGNSLVVGQRILDPSAKVRILLPQPLRKYSALLFERKQLILYTKFCTVLGGSEHTHPGLSNN